MASSLNRYNHARVKKLTIVELQAILSSTYSSAELKRMAKREIDNRLDKIRPRVHRNITKKKLKRDILGEESGE